ncbi:pantoate--beta-alanine ligase [Alkaliphilus serpentinus]|uniref:Pantothenate synthetase n=1 Tax=Alkaliphilus serpentinus TaxID=1482731 RepID=A0A833HP42_9FIRM|nr:pantoate--beta-alanine ligase [Alkaliphilus serpentinus]KAB3530251.1 pantoate--beta-alanine ligase [Alkaliphilus serpentinus]
MQIITTVKEMKGIVKNHKALGETIGFVPTMGYLHQGHRSLIERARKENDLVVVSIFVNPTQFGANEDFDIYPRDIDRDSQLTREAGGDYIFHPSADEIYPMGYRTYVEVTDITNILCGGSRPGHFKGVTTVVHKLFQIVSPTRNYFGLKDAQQVAVIQTMVEDLFMDIEIVPCPIIREIDGLAMSSRNVYLSDEDRKAALMISRSLFHAKEAVEKGERNIEKIKKMIRYLLSEEPLLKPEYVEAVSFPRLELMDFIEGRVLIALAVKVGKVRLIDNIIVEV